MLLLVKSLRGWSGPLLAALLTLAVLTPTLDMFVCADDQQSTAITVIASAMPSVEVHAASDLHKKSSMPAERHDADDSGCIHGHCHHGIGAAKLAETELAAEAAPGDGILPRLSAAPHLNLGLDLLRPPRA
jgi:hypothetical protein